MVFKTEIGQLKATVSLENIAGNNSCEDNTKMTSYFCLDTITLYLFRYTLYLLTEGGLKAWKFKYQNLVFSFLICVIILFFPLVYMAIECSFMNYSYTTKICVYIYIYTYIYICIYIWICSNIKHTFSNMCRHLSWPIYSITLPFTLYLSLLNLQ